MAKTKIKQKYLRELLEYDEVTGIFTWKERPKKMFENTTPENVSRVWRRWNNMYAGKVAGGIGSKGYWLIGIDNTKYLAHRLAFLFVHGVVPKYLDHIDHNPMNNRITNLRGCTHKQNHHNQKMRKNNTSGVMGVYWRKDIKKWAAQLMVDGRCIPLGTYKDKEKAIKARKDAQKEYGFHQNHGELNCG